MPVKHEQALIHAIRGSAFPLTGETSDFDPLLKAVGDSRFVLIGEASHGTHEFYRVRAQITKRLIVEKGFNAVAVEADWPDAYRIVAYPYAWVSSPKFSKQEYRYRARRAASGSTLSRKSSTARIDACKLYRSNP